jgi:Plant transposon protein
VENTFGIMCARWQVLARTMYVNPDRAQKIVAACVVLHNFLMVEGRDDYCPAGFNDTFDETGNLIEGSWRRIVPQNALVNSNLNTQNQGRPREEALEIRTHFNKYFNSPEGSLEWQNNWIQS